jgi:L-serine dehydratase
MTVSVFDLFKIGIGPSSSHTVGPMIAARRFVTQLAGTNLLAESRRVRTHLFGSLGATGVGHGTITAVILGLCGSQPRTIDPDLVRGMTDEIAETGRLSLLGTHAVVFDVATDVLLHPDRVLAAHPNALTFEAFDASGNTILSCTYYSVGGGFVVDEQEMNQPLLDAGTTLPFPYRSAAELLNFCAESGLSISELKLANEYATRPAQEVSDGLRDIWKAMQDCVDRGCRTSGELPGGLHVQRRAADLFQRLTESGGTSDPLAVLDWVNMYALAVNEENAAGGRVVTAPTNGAAGIIPAVLHYYANFVDGASVDGVIRFLLTAGAIGTLFKLNASISGAEVGCQGEVGSACAMAAGGLTEVLGGTPEQVENAAEIALEHNLGLTCDPVGGLVQIPCIERNAMASMKAINAARLSLHGDGTHLISLDQAIRTMRDTGRDMHAKYKETALGGLAVTFSASRRVPVAVNIVDC